MNLSMLSTCDLFSTETPEKESRRVGRSGPVLDDNGFYNFLYFIVIDEPLGLLPSLVVVPDASQSWVLVQILKNSWFAWVPIRLLNTMDSSKNQVRKMFDFMTRFLTSSPIEGLEDVVTDDLATFLHSKASNVLNQKNDQPVVIRVRLFRYRVRYDWGTDNYNSDDEIKYTLGPATKDFLESKLVRFEIGPVNEDCDDNGPCSICLENFQVGLVAKMPCGHLFHDGCITVWLETTGCCPICRFEADCEYFSSTSDDDDDGDVEGDSDDDVIDEFEDIHVADNETHVFYL